MERDEAPTSTQSVPSQPASKGQLTLREALDEFNEDAIPVPARAAIASLRSREKDALEALADAFLHGAVPPVGAGATLYLAPRFDPVAALAALERDRLTIVLGVPAMFALLADYAKAKGLSGPLKFPALRIISSSGAPLQPAVKSAVESLFGMTLHNGYGVTECSPTIAQARVEEPRSDLSVASIATRQSRTMRRASVAKISTQPVAINQARRRPARMALVMAASNAGALDADGMAGSDQASSRPSACSS